ncbi:sterol desaturase family protein [Seonamhaeicola sediminis]|uniref:Sterol desaturase family protein n=1 Tax=Seonamhaeicola sediminis TaxID=2528206 RepID=A0A562YFW3_9FLAO|nr:sterol desaturase family protein [Seonamhaeicola sediminis]TWO33275.1 sterol desaturase family protein [Seonamhaeicola sediminis]
MELELNELSKYVIPVFSFLIVFEYLLARHYFDLKESLSGIAIGIGASIMSLISKTFTLGVFILFFNVFKELRLDFFCYNSLGWSWYIWILAILCDDFNFYWHHRLSHSIRLLWAAHVPHHSSKSFNFIIGLRNGWFISLYKPIYWVWMAAMGFEPLMIAGCLIINSIYQFFLHTQMVPNLGIFERIFNTPKLHIVHHSCNLEYLLDKNHGGILIIWDKLFGTYKPYVAEIEPQLGILKDPKTHNPFILNTHEFYSILKDVKNTSSWLNKLKYIFYPPGWSPDRKTLTTRQLQKELLKQKL